MKKQGVFLLLILFSLLLINFVSAGLLEVTQEHPFYVKDSWIPANQLQVGDLLTTIDGKKARITGIEQVDEQVEVYNLEDSIFHNYIVSNDNLVVHNSIDSALVYRTNPNIAITWPKRLIGSLNAIKEIIKPGNKVVDVGVGKDAPTFWELVKGLGESVDTKAIELNPEIVPPKLRGKVIEGDILNLNSYPQAKQAIAEADVVRISNLAFQWFNAKQRSAMIEGLRATMKEGARLIMTHTDADKNIGFLPVAEEGFLYVKQGNRFIADSYLFEVRASYGSGVVAGDYFVDSVAKNGDFKDKYIWDALKKDICTLKKLQDYAGGKPVYNVEGGFAPSFLAKEVVLTEEIKVSVVRYLNSLGYNAEMMGDVLIRIKMQNGNYPPEIFISEGLAP